MKIVVRTYKRSDSILKNTLGVLEKQSDLDLAKDLILVVADKEELSSYTSVLKDYPVSDYIVSGIGGNVAINAAVDYLPEGEPVVFMDDDISDVKIWTDISNPKSKVDMTTLGNCYRYIFDQMSTSKLGSLFGVYSAANWTFKQNMPFFEFKPRQIGGMWWGGYNSSLMKTPMAHEDDNIRTAKYIQQDGGVYSFNWILASSKIGLNPGGMQMSGCRSDSDDRKAKTYDMCLQALEIPEVAKFFENSPIYKDSMEFYTLKMRNIRELRKLLQNKEQKWSTYFQPQPDKNSSLDAFF